MKKPSKPPPADTTNSASYPRHTIEKCVRIPEVILNQNAGRACSREKIAEYLGVALGGELRTEISSALKYGLLDAHSKDQLQPSDLAKKILRPKSDTDEASGYSEALLSAPQFNEVYLHYRGENLPDKNFLENALADSFKIPREKIPDFVEIFFQNLKRANLIQEQDGKTRVLDVKGPAIAGASLQKASREAKIISSDTCFVMMPFAEPLGGYYDLIYKTAIEKAGLTAVRADSDIFGTGKIIDQILTGIRNSKVLVAELTGRNPNVFYELGIAHALQKPVVLVSANEQDVPFDVRHIRVIYYQKDDPFWGEKLIQKVAENIISAVQNPAEAVLPGLGG